MEVDSGVFQFKVPMPAIREGGRERYTLVYAIDTGDGWVMVDTGLDTDGGLEALQTQISVAGIAPNDISLIVMTHGHSDHFGLAAKMRQLTSARVALHRLDATNPYVLPFDPQTQPASVDVLLDGGEELLANSGLWTIWTPGHTPGHICIHDRTRKLLFSGDHLLPITTPNVSRFPNDDGNPLRDFLEGHVALTKLDIARVHPAHEYSFDNLRERTLEIMLHHERRANEILSVAADGPRTIDEIAAGISWNVGTWREMPPDIRNMAIWETAAHVHFLVEEGRLRKSGGGPRGLLETFRDALGTGAERDLVLVGTGRLGRATLAVPELAESGYKIIAAFDGDPRQVGQEVQKLVIQPIERLKDVVKSSNVTAAIIAIPPQFTQHLVDRLVAAGVQTIINYNRVVPSTPGHVRLVNVDAVRVLQSSMYSPA